MRPISGHADARRLTWAIGFSAALHLSLMFGIAVRSPATAPIPGSLRAQLELGGDEAPARAEEITQQPAVVPPVRRQPVHDPAPRTDRVRPEAAPAELESVQPAPQSLPEAMHVPATPQDDGQVLPSVSVPLLVDPTWYAAKDLDTYPRALAPIRPHYPSDALGARVEGTVTVLLSIDESGRVVESKVVEADPEGWFETAALNAFEVADFQPGMRNGRSVRSRVLVKIHFNPEAPPSVPLPTEPSERNP
jgi:protein TonB